MKPLPPRIQLLVILPMLLAAIWGGSYYEISRSQREQLHDAETATVFQAQAYAENTLASIKRLNELLLDLRSHWNGRPEHFSETVRARQEHIGDITFQVAIIDREGYLAYSNLSPAKERVYLGEREHFRVHKNSGEDRLFISKPVLGKVSGKWSIQFTRPLLVEGKFAGVIVASISPDTFATFHRKLNLSSKGISAIARNTGEIMARYPASEAFLGKIVTGPFSEPDAPISGTFTRVAQLDGIERVFGYYKLDEYRMTFFVAESTAQLILAQSRHRASVLVLAGTISVVLAALIFLLYRALTVRERTLRQLRTSEENQRLLSTAVEQSNASVLITDAHGQIIFVNKAFVDTTGYSLAEVAGQNPRILKSGLAPQDLYRDLWQNITAGFPWKGELQNRKKGGETYWESVTISPVIDAEGRISHFIAIQENITERKRQEVELRQAKEAAEAASIAKSQFLATMSHEIRTPMNGILGMAQLLLLPSVSASDVRDYARTILNSGHTLQTLLDDILDLSKVEAGKLELECSAFDPAQMLAEIAALFAEPAQRKGLLLSAAWNGPADRRYRADPVRLRQMLSNLVSNAIKFTDHGTIRIEGREIQADDERTGLMFSVTDTGIGVPEGKKPLLFQAFSQVDSSSTRRYSGTGLGLSIVRNLAELMQGEAGVNSQEGKGSSFWFRILAPTVDAGRDTRHAPRPKKPAVAGEAGQAATIMVIEDMPINQKIIATMLGKNGYQVVCHDNGRQAIDALRAGPRPALVLMDCQMPEMNGFEASLEIRRCEREQGLPHLPIVALTASAFQEDREQCLAAGMDDFLSKPVDLQSLLATLDKWLDRAPGEPPA